MMKSRPPGRAGRQPGDIIPPLSLRRKPQSLERAVRIDTGSTFKFDEILPSTGVELAENRGFVYDGYLGVS